MASPFDLSSQLQGFTGSAPLFPLPNCVLFPHILLPLHIFEPRYRRMTEDALQGDRMLTIALLKDEPTPPDMPPAIHPVGCLGRIVADERLPDGRFYLVLQGLSRVQIAHDELTDEKPYRTGHLELLTDRYPPVQGNAREAQCRKILRGLRELFPEVQLERMFQASQNREVPLGVLCDVLAYALKLPPAELQAVLAELDVDRRCERLLQQLPAKSARSKPHVSKGAFKDFPPRFSTN